MTDQPLNPFAQALALAPLRIPTRSTRTTPLCTHPLLMSNPPRRSGGSKKKSSWRRPVQVFAVLLFLFLVGTVIVLSTVVHYFGVDKNSFLSEDEVPWHPEDAIKPLRDPVEQTELSGSTSADDSNAKRAEDFTEILDDDAADDNGAPAATGSSAVSPSKGSTTSAPVDDAVWGIDGKGTGGYWMRKDWDGKVANTHSWDRLYNITAR